MARSIKARFSKGIIEPLEKLEFEEGKEMIITISEIPCSKAEKILEALKATSGGWKDLIDAEELKKNIYADRLVSTRPEIRL